MECVADAGAYLVNRLKQLKLKVSPKSAVTATNKQVAIKAEPLNQQFSQLLREIQNFKALESTGFPTLLK